MASLDGFRIGINWQGAAHNLMERDRAIPLSLFAALADLPGVRLISLQKGDGTSQLAETQDRFDVIDLGTDFDEAAGAFMDTAAVMKNLDLIITSDTSIAHLAGALGVPVWLALSWVPEWRWLLDRQESPWYPTMRLFRQDARGDWERVFRNLRSALRKLLPSPPGHCG